MILHIEVDVEELADSITQEAEYEEIVQLVCRVDEILADSVFTDMLYDAIEERMVEMHRDDS